MHVLLCKAMQINPSLRKGKKIPTPVQQVERYRALVQTRNRSQRGFSELGDAMQAAQSDQDNVDAAWKLQSSPCRNCKRLRAKTYRSFGIHDAVRDAIESRIVFLNQGGSGACFFMSLMNLYQFTNAAKPPWFRKLKNETGVRSVYNDLLGLPDDGFSSFYAALLTIGKMSDIWEGTSWLQFFHHFHYESFRGVQGRWNKTILKDDYDENVQDWLETKLDEGCVVAVPFMQHFCCIVGYNTSHFLFLNSYGERHDQGGLSPMTAYTKRELASLVEDCFYLRVSTDSGESKMPEATRLSLRL